jgi:Tfp pilus assembly protein PilF
MGAPLHTAMDEKLSLGGAGASVESMTGKAVGLLVILGLAGCGQHIERSNEKSAKRLDIAKDFLRKNELEAAEAEANKAISYNPQNDEAYVVRGLVHMIRAYEMKRSMEIESCLTGVDAEASDRDLQTFLSKADVDFEQAAAVTPDYGEAWANRGVVHNLQMDYGPAAQYLSKALENPMRLMNPSLTRAHLGWSLFNQSKYVEAAKELRTAIQFQPKMCVATYRLARVYFAREEWEKAAELFQTASEDPSCGSQEASYYLMKTRMQQGLVSEAKNARNACVKLSATSCIATKCRADGGSLGP